jgi:hypothetical protein
MYISPPETGGNVERHADGRWVGDVIILSLTRLLGVDMRNLE